MNRARRRTLAGGCTLMTALLVATAGSAQRLGGAPVALVTAESENMVLAVSLPSGAVLRRVRVAADPQTVVSQASGPAVVVSPASRTVTLLAWRTLRPLAVLRGFSSPQLAAITPDGEWVYVTDARTGDLTVIDEQQNKIVARVFVGYGAHHLAVSPDQRRVWVALGERASSIIVLEVGRPARPRVVGRIRLNASGHDLAFAPDGRTVWVGSAQATFVSVLDARSGRLVGTVPAGPAPQHIAFSSSGNPRAFVTSGYGSSIELVDPGTRRILRRARLPFGSFNLATAGDLVVASSLLNGTVSELNGASLARWMTSTVASRTRGVAISVW